MKTIYIDSDFRCHTAPGDGLTAVETEAFDGKCDTYIEGYRYVPAGQVWIREDGVEFSGEMISPWKDYEPLAAAQKDYELEQALAEIERLKAAAAESEAEKADMANALALLGMPADLEVSADG